MPPVNKKDGGKMSLFYISQYFINVINPTSSRTACYMPMKTKGMKVSMLSKKYHSTADLDGAFDSRNMLIHHENLTQDIHFICVT